MRQSADGNAHDNDDCLMRAVANGSEDAFDLLLMRHRDWVCRLMATIVQDGELAEDLTQQAFYRVYRQREDYRGTGQFIPWLRRIAVNLARNALRDRQREREMKMSLINGAEQTQAQITPETDPARLLHSRLLHEEMREALALLTPEHREVLILYYFIGAAVPEIARRTACPEGTVKSRLFHARQKLRAYSERFIERNVS